MDEDVPDMISATKTATLNEIMPMTNARNERVKEMNEKITRVADSAQEALENLRRNAGSDWGDWSLLDDSDFQSLKERVEHLERGYLVGFPNRVARPRGQARSGALPKFCCWRVQQKPGDDRGSLQDNR